MMGGLIFIWVLWALLLFGGFMFGSLSADRTRRMPRWTRLLSSLMLVCAAIAWYSIAPSTYTLMTALGMMLGFIGDLFMADVIKTGRFNPVLGGMAAFGLGHVAYIVGIASLLQAVPWLSLGVWLLIGTVGWYVVVFRTPQRTMLHYAALPYALLLAATAGMATGLSLEVPFFWPLAFGAALFLLSDLILAAQLFNGLRFYLISDVVWLTYGPGQMLIVYAASAYVIDWIMSSVP